MNEKQIHVWDFLDEFAGILQDQLEEDEKKWDDEWRKRGYDHNERIFDILYSYFDEWDEDGVDIPWLKVAGLALIGWIRENHPEALYEES